MNSRKSDAMNHVREDQEYYVCSICGYRMKKKESDIRRHLKNAHEIGPETVVEDYASVPTKLQMGFCMKEWLKSRFTLSDDQEEWRCKLCSTILVGSEPWMNVYNHLKKEHFEILVPVAYNRSMPGSSSSTADVIASTLSRNESPTAGMSSHIPVPFHIKDEGMNENLHSFEAHMYIGQTEEDLRRHIENEDTIDLGNKYHKESRISIGNGSEKLEVDVKSEITDDVYPTEPASSVIGNGRSDENRSGRSNDQGCHNSSTDDKQNIKLGDSEHDKSDDDIQILESKTDDSGRRNDISSSANPSLASSKRLSVTSTSHMTPTKRAKPESSGTDPVDGNSSRDANRPLPDSNTTSSSASSEARLLSITGQIIRSMSIEEKKSVLQAVLGQLGKKRK